MNCNKCGEEISEDSQVCPSCGNLTIIDLQDRSSENNSYEEENSLDGGTNNKEQLSYKKDSSTENILKIRPFYKGVWFWCFWLLIGVIILFVITLSVLKVNYTLTVHNSNGDKYVGQYVFYKIDGSGTYYYANGDKYVGQFKNNKSQGNGTYYYLDGDKYDGQYKNDKREGTGSYYFANGYKYVGQFKNDQQDGTGALYNSDGAVVYEGKWSNGEIIK
jgi:hypothetical protein